MADVSNEFLVEMLRRIQSDISELQIDVRAIGASLLRIQAIAERISVQQDRSEQRFAPQLQSH